MSEGSGASLSLRWSEQCPSVHGNAVSCRFVRLDVSRRLILSPEAFAGELLVRIGLSVIAVSLAITALIIAVRTRTTDYPAKLANKLAELEADVHGFEIKLQSITTEVTSMRGKIAAHARHNKPAPVAEIPADIAVAPAEPLTVDQALWHRMSEVQRQGMIDQGYTVAG